MMSEDDISSSHYNSSSFTLLSIIYNMFVHVTSRPLDLDQMRMASTKNNSIAKKILAEKIFSSQFSVELINSILTIFITAMKILGNSKMKWNRKNVGSVI